MFFAEFSWDRFRGWTFEPADIFLPSFFVSDRELQPRCGIDSEVGSSKPPSADLFLPSFCGAPRAAEMRDQSIGWEFEPTKRQVLFFCRVFAERRGLLFKGTRQDAGLILRLRF